MKLRLPFALGLAMASVTLAAVRLWPFTPPGTERRIAASQAGTAPDVLRPFLNDALYRPLEKAEPGDWLDSVHEWPQSVEAYRRSRPNLPDQSRKVLYLMPLGDFPAEGRAPSLEVLCRYLGLYFGMEARLTAPEPESAPGAARRINSESGKPQLRTTDILKWLPGRLPADAYALLAVTMTDLYPRDSWNFVFGEATLKERVGVFSLARNDPEFFAGAGSFSLHPLVKALILRRACVTLSHEAGHMFGWAHCRFYQCLMGGSGSLEESDRTPAGLCPVCLHKLYHVQAFDPVARLSGLLEFYGNHGLKEEANQARGLLEALGK